MKLALLGATTGDGLTQWVTQDTDVARNTRPTASTAQIDGWEGRLAPRVASRQGEAVDAQRTDLIPTDYPIGKTWLG